MRLAYPKGMRIDPKMTVAEISRKYPAAMKVFQKYKIDLCCGGVHPLQMVAEKHKLDLSKILKDLEAAVA